MNQIKTTSYSYPRIGRHREFKFALEKFWQKTNQLDGIRNENILDVIPELGALK